mmetsp:Transcript_24736/g.63743  ORF Transcript_24736/g.63743 Transcript_24736/m.63743 type:complete len:209 (-) Transcript_24736:7386-8012(-)
MAIDRWPGVCTATTSSSGGGCKASSSFPGGKTMGGHFLYGSHLPVTGSLGGGGGRRCGGKGAPGIVGWSGRYPGGYSTGFFGGGGGILGNALTLNLGGMAGQGKINVRLVQDLSFSRSKQPVMEWINGASFVMPNFFRWFVYATWSMIHPRPSWMMTWYAKLSRADPSSSFPPEILFAMTRTTALTAWNRMKKNADTIIFSILKNTFT